MHLGLRYNYWKVSKRIEMYGHIDKKIQYFDIGTPNDVVLRQARPLWLNHAPGIWRGPAVVSHQGSRD
jgi:hypothetical protein